MGAGTNSTKHEFIFCVVNQTTFQELRNARFPPNLATKRISVSRRGIRKDSFENFHFRGHLPPKFELEYQSNMYLTQSRLQVTVCTAERYYLLHVVVQGPGSFRGRSTFLYDVWLRSYGASKLQNFRILAYFLHIKPLKRTFWWSAYSPGVTSQNDYDFSTWQLKVQRDAFRHQRFPATSGKEAWEPQTPQIFPYGKSWLYPYRIQLHGASDLDQRCLKTRRSAVVAFIGASHQISLPLSPKPHLGGPFNAKPIIERVLHKSHVNGATKLKLYIYIGIGKYLSVCQNYSTRGRLRGRSAT